MSSPGGALGTHTIPGPPGSREVLYHPAERSSRRRSAALICQPHPAYGGSLHSRVVFHLARAFRAGGLATLRFNFRGVGLSEGAFDEGCGEQEDARAALAYLGSLHPGVDLVVAGHSFGAWVGLRVGAETDRVRQLVGIGVPVALYEFGFLSGTRKDVLLISGGRDQLSPSHRVRDLGRRLGARAQVVILPGADHFLEGGLEGMGAVIREWFGSLEGRNAAGETPS